MIHNDEMPSTKNKQDILSGNFHESYHV